MPRSTESQTSAISRMRAYARENRSVTVAVAYHLAKLAQVADGVLPTKDLPEDLQPTMNSEERAAFEAARTALGL